MVLICLKNLQTIWHSKEPSARIEKAVVNSYTVAMARPPLGLNDGTRGEGKLTVETTKPRSEKHWAWLLSCKLMYIRL